MNTTFNVLNTIQSITKQSRGSHFEADKLEPVKEEVEQMAGYLQVSEIQALFFSVIFSLNYSEPNVNIEDLAHYFRVSAIDILSYHRDIENMMSYGILENKKNTRRTLYMADRFFRIPNHIVDAVLNNREIEHKKEDTERDFLSFLYEMDHLFEMRYEDAITTQNLFREINELIGQYEDLNEIQKIEKLRMDKKEKAYFFYICLRTVSGRQEVNAEAPADDIFDNLREWFLFTKKILRKHSLLFDHGLIEFTKSIFRNKQRIKLTTKGLNMMFGEDEDLFIAEEQVDNLIRPENIKEKSLFYNEEESEKIHFLQKTLKKDKLSELQERLRNKNLSPGITVLFHGSPGTGKTETVKQIAKQTGRELIYVDMSNTKSMWFGESEKKVKEIFDKYNSYSKQQGNLPVLLFNEADALFSSRKEVNHSAVSQTENAIQNILLEQLEIFEGILIATTNLTVNLDKAFDRRFLYKIQFDAPSVEVMTKIWKSKLETFSREQCQKLAAKYNFTGGQIDNIASKVVTQEVLHGQKPGIKSVMSYCEDEYIQREKKKVGYKK